MVQELQSGHENYKANADTEPDPDDMVTVLAQTSY